MTPPSTFSNATTAVTPENWRRRFSVRPAWMVRAAPLGKLRGLDHVLVGALLDDGADTGESAICYGIADTVAVSMIESELGSPLESILDKGVTLRATVEK